MNAVEKPSRDVHAEVVGLLRSGGAAFRTVHHEPTRTSEESARARGEPLEAGGKAIVMKLDDTFAVFVISAARKIDARRIRARLGARKSRFATPEELVAITGLVPGAVPPFGRPVLDLDLYADASAAANDRIAFNAGSLTDSVVMDTRDWLRIARPVVFDFADDPNPPEEP